MRFDRLERIACRCAGLSTENLPSLPDPQAIQFWMGPDAHPLQYAIGPNGEAVNFFAVVATPRIWMHEGSVVAVQEEVPVASFRGWHPDLGIDSLTLVEVVVAAEDRFGLVIADDEWSRFTTVGDIIAHIERA